jgi:hypothetical protein
MTDAPRVSRERLRELIDSFEACGYFLMQHQTDAFRALRELLALRTPNEHGSALAQEAGERKLTRDEWRAVDRAFWASVNDASPAVSEPAEPVSKSVAKRIAAQKGEPYPFTAEPVCATCSEMIFPPTKCPDSTDCSPTGLTREEDPARNGDTA